MRGEKVSMDLKNQGDIVVSKPPLGVFMEKKLVLNQSKLLGFKLLEKPGIVAATVTGAKIGKVTGAAQTKIGAKIGKGPIVRIGAKIGKMA